MKKLIALTLTVIFILALSSCADSLPMSQLPGIQLSGGNLLPSYEVLICRSGDKEDTDGIGSELSPEEIIVQYKDQIPMTKISDEQITLIAGAEYVRSGWSVKSINYEINFVGVYTIDGVKLEYTVEQLSELPEGEYIICVMTSRKAEDETEENYLFSGVNKETQKSIQDRLNFGNKSIASISVSSLPEGESYKRTITSAEKINEIVDFINSMTLTEDFSENPDEYDGMTLVLHFRFADNSYADVYSFGNMFLKINDEPWLRMEYDDAMILEGLLLN